VATVKSGKPSGQSSGMALSPGDRRTNKANSAAGADVLSFHHFKRCELCRTKPVWASEAGAWGANYAKRTQCAPGGREWARPDATAEGQLCKTKPIWTGIRLGGQGSAAWDPIPALRPVGFRAKRSQFRGMGDYAKRSQKAVVSGPWSVAGWKMVEKKGNSPAVSYCPDGRWHRFIPSDILHICQFPLGRATMATSY
jgi:hypothetical protein